jgi:hypothetical protein
MPLLQGSAQRLQARAQARDARLATGLPRPERPAETLPGPRPPQAAATPAQQALGDAPARAIDRLAMRGGRVLAFVAPFSR